ncbi:hypothetical protein CLOSYM_00511 [[Clostridium] symbiosum ATCC 14940]|uniref:Uncharacterized protein n=1 Tax=[Clostridium] symbiosum ATCC 14940 TaxID=411472 RepID=A0ABC9U345_CLOSY|nr:hypothetical protein CLOSYM_00511 [[Clostridium] symbiosum ATCC 14940]
MGFLNFQKLFSTKGNRQMAVAAAFQDLMVQKKHRKTCFHICFAVLYPAGLRGRPILNYNSVTED